MVHTWWGMAIQKFKSIYHSKRRENVCTVKSLQLTAHSRLESELRCCRQCWLKCWVFQACAERSGYIVCSELRLQWCHTLQHGQVLPDAPKNHCMFDFELSFGHCAFKNCCFFFSTPVHIQLRDWPFNHPVGSQSPWYKMLSMIYRLGDNSVSIELAM